MDHLTLARNLPSDEYKLFSVIVDISNHQKTTATIADIAYTCNMTVDYVMHLLNNLQQTYDMLTIDGKKRKIITFNSDLAVPTVTIRDERPDQTVDELNARIQQLERELAETQAGNEDGLTKWLKGEEQHLAREIVGFYGRPLNPLEAYYLGQMVQGFGIARVKKAFYMRKGNKSPLRSAYALLKAGASGKPAAEKESEMKKIYYKDLGG